MTDDYSFYKSIFSEAAFAIVIKNIDDKVVEANVAAQVMFGYTKEDFLLKKKEELIILDTKTASEYKADRNYFKKKPTKAVGIRKNGEVFPIRFTSFLLENREEGNNKVCLFIYDISKEIEKENELERIVEILKETNREARVGGYEVDITTGKARWTRETKEIHELPPDYEPQLSEAILFYKEGEVRNTIIKVVQNAIEHGIPYAVELPLTTAKGNDRWIKATGNTEFKDGKCVRLYGIIQDIHETKMMEDALRKEKNLLRTLIDNLPVAVFVKDNLGRKLIGNKADLENINVDSEEEMIGKTDLELFSDDHSGYEKDLKVLSTGNPTVNDLEIFYDKSGEKSYNLTSKYPLFDANRNVTGLVGISRNISAQIKLEEKLRLVDFAFKNAAVSIFLVKDDASFYDFNDMAHDLLGYTKEEMMELKVEDINPEYNVAEWPHHWAELREKKRMVFTSVEKRKDGTCIDVEIKANLIKYGDFELNCAFVTEITERKKAEADLAKSNERYAYALKATSDVIWDVDLKDNTIVLSEAFEVSFGHKTHPFESADNNVWINNVHPDDVTGVLNDSNNAIINNKEVWEHEYRLRKANGEYAYVLDKGFVLRDTDGNAVRLTGAIQDITRQKEAEIILKRSNERYEYATLATSDMIWESDLVTKEVFFSKNFETLFGYTINELQTTDNNIWKKNIHPDDLEKIVKKRIKMLQTHEDKWDDEYRFKKANGDYAWILDKTLIIRDDAGNPVKLVGAIRDITNRKEAEITLKKSNERYEFATMATSDAIWEADLENNLLFLSDNYSKIFGHKSGVYPNDSDNEWMEYVHPEDLPNVLALVDSITESKNNKWENEYRLLNGEGTYSVVLNRGFVVRDENGKAVRLVGAMRDITVKRMEEERLKLLETVIINSTDAIVITSTEPIGDVDHPIIYVNKAFTDITGYRIRDLIGKTPRILQGPLSDRKELDKMVNAIKNWLPCEIEIINYKKDGTPFWSNISIVPVANEKGWYTHWVSIQKDITARKESEKAFAEMAALQRSILDSANFSIISTDTNGVIKSFNEGAELLLGYKAEEVINIHTPMLIHDAEEVATRAKELSLELGKEVKPRFDVFVAKARLGISTESEWTYINKNGQRLPVMLSVTTLQDAEGALIGYLCIGKDITYEKQMKEELRTSYEKLEETVNELRQNQFAIDQHDIVSITDVKGTIIYANESFCKISKYDKEELIGNNHRIVKSGLHPSEVFKEMYHTLATGHVWKGDLCNMAKDGTLYWVSNTIVPYMDSKTNKPIRYVSIRTDITDKKLAELEREKLIGELTNNNRELKQFSYITSHNLRSPLTNLLSICNLIKPENVPDPLTSKLIEGFKKSTHDLNDTLNDLISILIIKENTNLPTGEISFGDTLDKVISSINKSIERTGTVIQSDFSNSPTVHFNPSYLESIFLNLITNSIKYARQETYPVIQITTSKNEDGTTKLVFTDNGIGMNMEKVKNKIFGLYQRFHTNSDSKGIGLYLIYSQITALGGKIEFYSEVNIGTTFTLTFK